MDYGNKKTKTNDFCHKCNRMLLKRTKNIIFYNPINDYVSVCKFCLIENPNYGR